MSDLFRDKEHLVRMAALFAVGLGVFLVVRALMVPAGFGKYGHYREGALQDNRSVPIHYAGRKACEECHADVVEARRGSKHATVGCESCHGPLAAHAEDPGTLTPQLPDKRSICLVCHRADAAKPAGFPQVDPKEHAGDSTCDECHNAHHPEIS
jgi:hypothetical protein